MPDKPPALPRGLYAIVDDGRIALADWLPFTRALLGAGCKTVQFRAKKSQGREVVEVLKMAVQACRAASALALVNDRADWALVAGADGVHLGDADIPLEVARAVLGPAAVLGFTARTPEAVVHAERAGAHYVGVGPVFASQTKSGHAKLLGIEGLAAVVRAARLPVVAIAGIDETNIAQVSATGTHAAAVAAGLGTLNDVSTRARNLEEAFLRGSTTLGPP